MPVYAYKCRDCGSPLEVRQEFDESPLTTCPTCGGALRKQYGTVGVTFNGSGFYRTDSRAGGPSKPGEAATSPKPESAPKSDGAKDAKPAAAPSAS